MLAKPHKSNIKAGIPRLPVIEFLLINGSCYFENAQRRKRLHGASEKLEQKTEGDSLSGRSEFADVSM